MKRGRVTILLLCVGVGVLLSALTGCKSSNKSANLARERAKAFELGRQQGMQALAEQQIPSVLFRGDIRYPRVPWHEGMTLAQALLAAQYTWNWDPRSITVTRNGSIYVINVRRFMRGQDNPELEAGDLVEVLH